MEMQHPVQMQHPWRCQPALTLFSPAPPLEALEGDTVDRDAEQGPCARLSPVKRGAVPGPCAEQGAQYLSSTISFPEA